MSDEIKAPPSGTPLGNDALGALLSNPETLGKLRQVLVGLTQSAATTVPPDTENATEASPDSQSPTAGSTDGLSALLSNPAVLEKLPQMLALIKPMLGTAEPRAPSAPQSESHEACRDRLLLALKPFLSSRRCEAIDTMLQISRLGSVFQQLK